MSRLGAAALILACMTPPGPAAAAPWALVRVGDMTLARHDHAAVTLRDGRVLVTGGSRTFGSSPVRSAEIFDPVTASFVPCGEMTLPRVQHSVALLNDGRVLIVGGWVASYIVATATTEIFDPRKMNFTASGSLSLPRADDKPLAKLRDGRVVLLGGTHDGRYGEATDRVEVFDPSTGRWARWPGLVLPRGDVVWTSLGDNRILLTEGSYRCCGHPLTSIVRRWAELWEGPGRSELLDASAFRFGHSVAATSQGLLVDVPGSPTGEGIVEVVGIRNGSFECVREIKAPSAGRGTVPQVLVLDPDDVAIFDILVYVVHPATGRPTEVVGAWARVGAGLSVLTNGCVLACGGIDPDGRLTREAFELCPTGE